jgi:hypothetical protein
MSTVLPLKVKLELRAITNNHLNRERAVMISSTIPSAKYSCSGSPLMFSNGSTAMEGLSGRARVWVLSIGGFVDVAPEPPAFVLNRHARIGSVIFFRFCGPIS